FGRIAIRRLSLLIPSPLLLTRAWICPHHQFPNTSCNMAAPSSPLYGENHAGLAHEDDDHFYDDKDHSQGTPLNDPKHMQKRRRVTRACDECRRKKIKCDGKQPCTHCTVYS